MCGELATGTLWVAYHHKENHGKHLFLVYQDVVCDKHGEDKPESCTDGRLWGFVPIVTKNNWEIMNILDKLDLV